ncbi:hypothetical protein B4102_3579 [Heyndrickxia sporothermodurans]|uniref:DUF1617 family protein n=1 Tax=Heyndrickxia sporothermodurans TaxID=46224 RepID=A0A150KNY8_9BACI|nr:DUF1617 family protein [Heyndrickxia sporothermodurans]KYC94358.1 hypothetical protein B4102_3579 [Heyndrickxia sporothermodurans]
MQVKIENQKLGQAINLLFNLSLKGKQSRHRSKFIKALNEKLNEFAEQEQELLKEHCHLDENGEPKKTEDGTIKVEDIKDIDAFTKDRTELYEEERVFEGGDAQVMLKTVKDVLLNCEREWSGQEAVIYDYLCEQFENGADE